jgi:hypothetical protein
MRLNQGDRVVINATNSRLGNSLRGVGATVIKQDASTLVIRVKPDGRRYPVEVLPYEVQREEVWNQTHLVAT